MFSSFKQTIGSECSYNRLFWSAMCIALFSFFVRSLFSDRAFFLTDIRSTMFVVYLLLLRSQSQWLPNRTVRNLYVVSVLCGLWSQMAAFFLHNDGLVYAVENIMLMALTVIAAFEIIWALAVRKSIRGFEMFSIWLTFVLFWFASVFLLDAYVYFYPNDFQGISWVGDKQSVMIWLAFQCVAGMTFGDVVPYSIQGKLICCLIGMMGLVIRFLVIGHFSEIFWSYRRLVSTSNEDRNRNDTHLVKADSSL